MLKRYVRLARIGPAFIPYPLGFLLGVACVQAWHPHLFYAFLSLFWTSCAGHAANDAVDVEVDALATKIKDRPPWRNPVLTGEISKRNAYLFTVATTGLALLFAWLVGHIFFAAMIIWILGGILCYSILYFKAKPLLDLTFPLTTGAPLFTAGYYLSNPNQPLPILHIIAFTILTITGFLDTVIHDITFDRRAGLRTTAVFLGEKNAARLEKVMVMVAASVSVIGFLLLQHPFFLLLLVLIPTRWLPHLMQRLYAFAVAGFLFIILSFLHFIFTL